MTTTTLPGQLILDVGSTQKRRQLAATADARYKIVPVQVAMPAALDDAMIIEALNWVLTSLAGMEGPLAHDWQFVARDGAVGDNDHFREAVIPKDDLFAGAPQAIFEDWYLIPEGVQCPQCEQFFTKPDDLDAIGDHALCTACTTAWRMTAATLDYDAGGGDGYGEEPPFLPIPEWWAARGLAVPTEDAPPDAVEEPAAETNSPIVLRARQYFSAKEEDFDFKGPFNDEVEACQHWPASETEYVRIIEVLAPLGAKVEVDYWELGPDVDEDTLQQTWNFEVPAEE